MANNPPFPGIQPLQPPLGSVDTPRNYAPPMPVQFRPVVLPQQPQHFIPVAPPHFQSAGRGVTVMNPGLPPHSQQLQFPQPMQHLPSRPTQSTHLPPPSQPVALPTTQPSALPPPTVQTPSTYASGFGGPGAPLSSSFTFAPPSYGQPPINFNPVPQYQPVPQMQVPNIPIGGQPRPSSVNHGTTPTAPLQHIGEQPSVSSANVQAISVPPKPTTEAATDWKEHVSTNGRRYYYNKKTKQSTWEKPYELMTPIERADATTDWKEFTSPDGRKYYYNRVTKQSKWEIPEELKLAREQLEKTSTVEMQSDTVVKPQGSASIPTFPDKMPSGADASSTAQEAPSSPVPVVPVAAAGNLQSQSTSEVSAVSILASSAATSVDEDKTAENSDVVVPITAAASAMAVNTKNESMDDSRNFPALDAPSSADKVPAQDEEEAGKDDVKSDIVNSVSLEERAINQEPLTYADKQEAKNAFKSLLESANIGADWTWDQAMRVIINDRRYGALRTLGERKQAFNEFLGQKKRQEAEERRVKQKKAREEFKNMLEESTELTSTTRWSKVLTMFENDERFKAVERERERRDLFDTYLQELGEKERAKAQEERKRNITEYRKFLESCDFIKANTQWRKVQDRLEADESCSRLEKIDRLEIFQDYLRDLEKEEEEQRKIQKEELRKAERKNRDDFRKLMEEHVADGTLTAKTHWRDYYMKIKDIPAYLAVASNTSGSTPKDLFEDVAEELEKQYHDDKARIKDAVKLRKVVLPSTCTLEEFKAAIAEEICSPPILDVNLKMVFDELLERTKEKEEKEAKKRKRLADDFLNLLHSIKEITESSEWENCRELFEGSREFSSIGEESLCREIFGEYITQLKEQAKEKERKRKDEKAKKEKEREEKDRRKAKHRREKDRGHEREKDRVKKEEADMDDTDVTESQVYDENKRSGGEGNKKQKKRHRSDADDQNETEKDRSKSSHRHSSDHKRSKRRASTPESDDEIRHKKHKRDHRNGSRRSSGGHEELEDGEFGEDGEAQ